MCIHLYKATGIKKNQGNRTPPKDYSKPPELTPTPQREIQEFPNKESKIIVLKMLRELQESTSNLRISGKQYKNKMRSSTKRKHKKRNRNFGAEEYND